MMPAVPLRLRPVAGLLAVLVAVSALCPFLVPPLPAAAQTAAYAVVDLGMLQDTYAPRPYAVNVHGQVVGGVNGPAAGQARAFLYRDGAIQDLGALPGDTTATAFGLNDVGQVVGASSTSFNRAFLWQAGAMRDLGTLGGADANAGGINNLGQVVGGARRADGQWHAFLWENGSMRDLGTLPDQTYSAAHAVSDTGLIVGIGFPDGSGGAPQAWLHRDGQTIALGTLGGDRSIAQDVNGAGQVVGGAATANGMTHAFLWQDGVMRDLDTRGSLLSIAHAINNRGEIVGQSDAFGGAVAGTRAVLWKDGAMVDLNTLIPSGSGWELFRARDVNDAGQITGEGYLNGVARAFLLTPLGGTPATATATPSPTATATATPTPTPTPVPPQAPGGLDARAYKTYIALVWQGSTTGGVTYDVYRGTAAGGAKERIASGVPGTSYRDATGLLRRQRYYYQVTARGPGGESAPSNEASALAR